MSRSKFSPNDITFSSVADMYVAELRKGANPSIEDFAKAFPHLANTIYRQFPSLLLLEEALHKKKEWNGELPDQLKKECRIESEIGRGAMGIVYRGYQPALGRHVAIKIIPLQKSFEQSCAARFDLERRAMARLDHPNIVPVYSFGSDDRHAYMVMKYVDGMSLDHLLHETNNYKYQVLLANLRNDWINFAKLGIQVASGLQHAHQQGTVHRDIKPANLLIEQSGKVWITDFGLAKMNDYGLALSQAGDAVGTPRYMAPEQLRGNCDARSDVYALGLTLYELAAGTKVWEGETLESLTADRSSLELPNIQKRVEDIPKDLAKIIMRACEFEPEKRYQSAKEMQFVLERFVAGERPGDRRGFRRVSDAEYRERTRRTMKLAVAGSVVMAALAPICVVFLRTPKVVVADSTPSSLKSQQYAVGLVSAPSPETRTPVINSNYLEKLAGIEEGNYDDEVTNFFKRSVDHSSAEFKFEDEDRAQILQQVENVLHEMKEREFTKEDIHRFVIGYRGTVIPLATRVIGYVRVIERSALNENERRYAFSVLRRFAKSIINRQVPEDDARLLEAILTQGRNYTLTDLVNMEIPADVLRHWISAINHRMVTLNVDPEDAPIQLSPEIERALQYAQQSSGAYHP